MNLLLKILTAIALLAIIVAACVVIVNDSSKAGAPQLVGPAPLPQTDPSISSYRPDPQAKPQFSKALDVAENPIQPSYKPINQPAYLQMLRQEGKTYRSVILGKLSGRASKSDWGVQGAAYFNYLYGLESAGKIIKNDGVNIIEERAFQKVTEELLVSQYEVGIDLGETFKKLTIAGGSIATTLATQVNDPQISPVLLGTAVGANAITSLDGKRIPIKKGWVNEARKSGIFDKFPQVDPENIESELRMFTQGSNDRLLEGKTVRIHFIDGQGVKTVEPIGCSISEKERDVIIRSNFVLDHYVFPDRKVGPGEEWTVDGATFSGFLDPRLAGKASGQVTIVRTPDFVGIDQIISTKLRLTDGNIVVKETGGSQTVTGQIVGLKGVLVMPDNVHIVTSASLIGYADYQSVSTDHVLFEAKHAVKPKFEFNYQCTVE